MYKCYIFLVFMVVILPSMGLTRYFTRGYLPISARLSLELKPISDTVGLPWLLQVSSNDSPMPVSSYACDRYQANSKVSALNSASALKTKYPCQRTDSQRGRNAANRNGKLRRGGESSLGERELAKIYCRKWP